MRALLATLLLLACGSVAAVTCNSASSGTWSAAARWSCGHIPLAADDVVILNTHVVDFTTANGVAQSVTVNNGGTLRFNSTTARTLTVSRTGSVTGTGNVTVANGGTFTVNNVTQSGHILRLDGDLTNNGTFNMAIDGNSRAIVEYNRNGAQTLTGTGATTNFQRIQLSMTSTANILDVTALSNLTFTNGAAPQITTGGGNPGGTFQLSSALTLTNVLNNSIPSGLRFIVNNAGATLSNTATLTVAAGGTLQVESGTFTGGINLVLQGTATMNGGSATVAGTSTVTGTLDANGGTMTITGNVTVNNPGAVNVAGGALTMNGGTGITINAGGSMLVTSGTATVGDEVLLAGGTLQIDNGTMNVGDVANERLVLQNTAGAAFTMNGGALNIAGRFTSNNATGGDSFTMTGGSLTVGTVGNSVSNVLNAPFFIGSATVFNLSGGTIVIQSDNTGAAAREYDVNAVTSTVTDGTVQFGNASTAAGRVFQVNSVAPMPNFTINATNDPAVTMISSVSVTGNWTNNSAGTFTPGANTVTFSGTVAKAIGGTVSTAFNNLTITKTAAAVVTANIDTTVNGTLTISNGNSTLADGGNVITATGDVANSGAHTSTGSGKLALTGGAAAHTLSGTGTYGNLELNDAFGATLAAAATPTIGGTLTLTAGVMDASTNGTTVATSAACPGSVAPSGTTAGGWVFGNLQLAIPSGTPDCFFRIGDSVTNFRPLEVAFSSVTTPGNLTASVVSTEHPNTTAGASGIDPARSVNRYWSLNGSTTDGTYTATFFYQAADIDGGATASSFTVRRGANCTGTGGARTCSPWVGMTVPPTPSNTQASASGVTIASGAAAADSVVGQLPAVGTFSRERQFIYTREFY